MLINGALPAGEVDELEKDTRLQHKYREFRRCDELFVAFVDRAEEYVTNPDPLAMQHLYSKNLACVSTAMCLPSFQQYMACVERAQRTGDGAPCKLPKRLLERCLTHETQKLLRATQRQVFRPDP